MRAQFRAAALSLAVIAGTPGQPALAVECDYVAPVQGPPVTTSSIDAPLPFNMTQAFDMLAGDAAAAAASARSARTPEDAAKPGFDPDAFAAALAQTLDSSTTGYTFQLRRDGVPLHSRSGGFARNEKSGDPYHELKWDADRRMHVASVSKLITAMALVRLLSDKGIGVDTPIIRHLPAYWVKGPNIEKVTFSQLMRHEAGFRTGTSFSDYRFMRTNVANGIDLRNMGRYAYENMNFGLGRVLIPIINGDIAADAPLSDAAWDDETFRFYDSYVRRVVFAPARVTGARLARTADTALAYDFPRLHPGWNTRRLSCLAGGAAWYMTLNEVISVLSEFRRGNSILPAAAAQQLLEAGFGIDRPDVTRVGTIFSKTGYWWRYSDKDTYKDLQMEQSLAAFLPGGLELVVFANSHVAPTDQLLFLIRLVRRTFNASVR